LSPPILTRIAHGEDAAIADCLDEYGDLVWRLARRYLGGASGDVEDAIQEVFVELWLSAPRFDPARGSEPAFIATVAHRRLIDYQRKMGSKGRNATRSGSMGNVGAPAAHFEDPTDREELRRLAAQFDQLPEEERQALWLALHRGLTHRQIGIATDAPVGTVKSRLRRAVMRLQEAIQGNRRGAESEGATNA